MKRYAMILALALCSVSLVFAQSPVKSDAPKAEAKPEAKPAPAAALPTVDQILDKYVQAIGGKAAVEKFTSRTAKGTFELPAMGATGTFESWAKAPNKNLMRIEIEGFGTILTGFDGNMGWAQDPMSGMRELSGLELAAMKLDSEFFRDIKLKELYTKLVVTGREKVGTGEAYVVEVTPPEGAPEKLYFDATSGLLVRHDAERENPQGKMPIESYFEDYREVDGLKIWHVMKQNTPAFSMTIKIAEVKHNMPVEDVKFNKPAAQ